MATKFGSYNNSSSPYMSWYAEYDYSRTSNSNVAVTVTVHGEILNHSSTSYMGSGNGITVSATVGGTTKTAEIKSSSDVWRGNTNNPRSCSFSFDVSSSSAGQAISVSYSVAGSGYTAPANVPTQSTSFSSPALLYTKSTVFASGNGSTIINVTINRQSADMTHTITYSYGSNSVTHTDVATSDSYDVPINWVTNATSARIDVTCETFLNGSSLGTSSDYGTFNVPASVVPSVEMNYQIVNHPLENVIKGISSIKFNCTASGVSGSTISSSYISFNDKSIPLDGSTGILTTAGDTTFTAHCEDSRGRSASKSVTIPIIDYEKPTIEITNIGNVDNKLSVSVSYSWYNISGNVATVKLLYRKIGDTEYTLGGSSSLSTYQGNITLQSEEAISNDNNYEVQVKLADSISSALDQNTIIQSDPIIDVYQDSNSVKSVGIGGVAKEDGKTTVYNPLTCLEPAQLSGGQWVHTATGTSGTAGYVKFAEIKVTRQYCDQSFVIDVAQREWNVPAQLTIRFAGNATTDPDAEVLLATESTNFWMARESTSTWGLYALKIGAYDSIDVLGYSQGQYNQLTVTWTDEQSDALPTGAKQFQLRNGGSGNGQSGYMILSSMAECWGYIQLTVSINSAWGSMYYGRTETQITYPLSFASSPSLSLTCEQISGNVTGVTAASSSVSGVSGLYFYAPVSTTVDIWLHWCARGKVSGM